MPHSAESLNTPLPGISTFLSSWNRVPECPSAQDIADAIMAALDARERRRQPTEDLWQEYARLTREWDLKHQR